MKFFKCLYFKIFFKKSKGAFNVRHLGIMLQQALLVGNYLLKGAVLLFFNIGQPSLKILLLVFKDGPGNCYIFIKTFNAKGTAFKILYYFYIQNFLFIIILARKDNN